VVSIARRFLRNIRQHYDLYLMILPGIMIIIIFNYLPMYGIQLAFREFSAKLGVAGGKLVGMKYVEKFIHSYQFTSLIGNTVRISLSTLILGFPVPILLALLFNHLRAERYKRVMQTTVYMPHFISTVVMVGILRVFFSDGSGVLSGSIKSLLSFNGNLMGAPEAFTPMYVLSEIWQHAGWNSIIYIAALSAIDVSIYDACKIDGASSWQVVRYIDWPCLIPTCVILLILNMGSVLGVGFEKAFLMQNSLNLPVSEVISTYVYKIGLLNNQYSYSAAISLFNTVINFFFVFAMNSIAKKFGNISLW
jgi:putative aldouronate transport system permease protein